MKVSGFLQSNFPAVAPDTAAIDAIARSVREHVTVEDWKGVIEKLRVLGVPVSNDDDPQRLDPWN